MTQQPFSRPGAIDLSALKGAPGSGPAGSAPPGGPASAAGQPGAGATSAYCVEITEQNFQEIVETSRTAPLLLVFYSPSQMAESVQLADDLETLSGEFEGKFLAGRVNIDSVPQIAQAMQIPSIPLVVVIFDGRPMPLLQDVVPLEELRTALTQVMQQLTAQGITGRHQPRTGAALAEGDEAEEAGGDPRYAAAQDALGEGDIDTAVAEYQRLVDAQIMVADLDMLGGHVDDAFTRLVDLVRRSEGDARNKAREHLLGLFGAVGHDDPRVLRGRQNLASALF